MNDNTFDARNEEYKDQLDLYRENYEHSQNGNPQFTKENESRIEKQPASLPTYIPNKDLEKSKKEQYKKDLQEQVLSFLKLDEERSIEKARIQIQRQTNRNKTDIRTSNK